MSTRHPTAITLAAYADSEMKIPEAASVGEHLRGCPECRAELTALRTLSSRLEEFAVPASLGQDLWGRVQTQLPARIPERQPVPPGFLRWLPPLGLVAFNAVLQSAVIVAALIWAIGRLGVFDLQGLASAWLPATSGLGIGSQLEGVGSALRWLLVPPLWPGAGALARTAGVDLADLVTWLLPGGLVLAISVGLALLYLAWLAAYWSLRQQAIQPGARAA